MFFQEKILGRLENQFDKLCDEMIRVLEEDKMDTEAASKAL